MPYLLDTGHGSTSSTDASTDAAIFAVPTRKVVDLAVLSGGLHSALTLLTEVDGKSQVFGKSRCSPVKGDCIIRVRRRCELRRWAARVIERRRVHTPSIVSKTFNDLPWFALYVKPRHEKNVSLILERKGYETFLPTYSHRARNSKRFELPLFPSYVFCRLELSTRLPVMTTPGVFSIVGNGPEPEAVSEEEVQGVRRLIASGSPVPWPFVMPGQEVYLESGPLQGLRGVVVDASNGKWLVVSVNLLRRSVAVKLERNSLSIKVPSASSATYRKPHSAVKISHA